MKLWHVVAGGVVLGVGVLLFSESEPEIGFIPEPEGEQSEKVLRWLPDIRRAQKKFKPKVPIPAILATLHHESQGNPKARGAAGEYGLMQLMPGTADMLDIPRSRAMEPALNIEGGVKLLSKLWKRYKGNLRKVFSAYNAGTATSGNKAYVDLSMSLYETYKGVS